MFFLLQQTNKPVTADSVWTPVGEPTKNRLRLNGNKGSLQARNPHLAYRVTEAKPVVFQESPVARFLRTRNNLGEIISDLWLKGTPLAIIDSQIVRLTNPGAAKGRKPSRKGGNTVTQFTGKRGAKKPAPEPALPLEEIVDLRQAA